MPFFLYYPDCCLLFDCKLLQINDLVRTRELVFLLSLFLFEGVFFSSGCLRKAALIYCDTPWAFHITILEKKLRNWSE